MNKLVATSAFTSSQLQIIRKSVAPDTNDDEFNLFIETCKLYGLSPMKRQIGARVYSKDNPKKRRMAIIVEIGGFRTLAARHGNYRPDDKPSVYTYDESAKDPATNPLGLVSVSVSVFKHDHGQWNRIVAEAYWDEFAPLEREWAYAPGADKKTPCGPAKLADNWMKMPRLMLAKVAESQALRKGWPDDLNGVYEDAEMDRTEIIEGSASEVLEHVAAEDRLKRISSPKNGYAIVWQQGEPIEMIGAGAFFDRVASWARADRDPLDIAKFRSVNRETLQRFWADDPNDALELKKRLEAREAQLAEKVTKEQVL